MLEVPTHVLEKLQCAKCDGYLSCGPIVINQEDEQLCGRCFKILPDDVKSQCVRQIGYEAVAELLIFPCKYTIQGCTYTFPFNNGTEHQVTCHHRNSSLSTLSARSTNSDYTYQSKEVELKVACDNFNGDEKLKLNIEVSGKDDNKLYLSNYTDNIKLNLELLVSLDVMPKVSYSHVLVTKENEEIIHDTIEYVPRVIICTNCRNNIVRTEIYSCVFGHSLCKQCKSSSCVICGTISNSESQRYCKNYTKGCIDLLPSLDIYKHEIDCEFNDFNCPLCSFVGSADKISDHVAEKHNVILSNELVVNLTKKDICWFFSCYKKLFRCNYYNYDDRIEFVVVYFGSNDNAGKYKYDVTLSAESMKSVSKISKCLGWNETLLDRAVSFEMETNLRKHFQVRIRIL